jgi:hypothetical protein
MDRKRFGVKKMKLISRSVAFLALAFVMSGFGLHSAAMALLGLSMATIFVDIVLDEIERRWPHGKSAADELVRESERMGMYDE